MGALVYVRYMWVRRERLGLEEGVQLPVLKEVKKFFGAGAAMVFRQVNIRSYCFSTPFNLSFFPTAKLILALLQL